MSSINNNKKRLTRAVFERVRRSLLVVRASHVAIRFVCGVPAGFSVVVPKTVSKRAVDRNTLRRQVFEFLRRSDPPLKAIVYIQSALPRKTLYGSLQKILTVASGRCGVQKLKESES